MDQACANFVEWKAKTRMDNPISEAIVRSLFQLACHTQVKSAPFIVPKSTVKRIIATIALVIIRSSVSSFVLFFVYALIIARVCSQSIVGVSRILPTIIVSRRLTHDVRPNDCWETVRIVDLVYQYVISDLQSTQGTYEKRGPLTVVLSTSHHQYFGPRVS